MDKKAREYAQGAIKFIQKSGSNFLACKNIREKLEEKGFKRIEEGDIWNLEKNEGYVFSKQNRNICSFFIGKNFSIHKGSILISIGHIDSCCLKISPNNNLVRSKLNQLNVECYGSGLWHTWFDRSLGLSGQVVYKKGKKLVEKLIQIDKSILFLPSLAIHLQNRTRFEFNVKINYENHLKPILSTLLYDQLVKGNSPTSAQLAEEGNVQDVEKKNQTDDQLMKNRLMKNEPIEEGEPIDTKIVDGTLAKCDSHQENPNASPLLYVLAKELKCAEMDILDFELCLMDVNEPCFTGAYEEFIEGARFDNLLGSYCIFQGFAEMVENIKASDRKLTQGSDPNGSAPNGSGHTNVHPDVQPDVQPDVHNNLYICIGYDHEEIGSLSEVGAQSYFTQSFIKRILSALCRQENPDGLASTSIDELYGSLMNRSLLLSVDMAHCSHPNYPETVQTNHQLFFHEGIAIKYNTNKNYVTSPYYTCLLKRTFELFASNYKEPIKYQNFMVKNDTPCGSTVGSMLASNLSMPGIDIGIPQLAMHSIREIAAIRDIYYLIKGVLAFYTYYNQVHAACVPDA
ncbi:M18 aspartyl aminopeptidase [Plasmodium gonderi]|uniref:aspartyl aminopeptidase n=1 Tax=Plasmodium gonderi TaxID=77519 RepID=A0A1Y1JFF9_PLAGO|nr:M18 aspartyl aminopeptidase [Plasmodium gonderi]GAW80388.1 M18 aspartyl aminopeptidase [Plasmodium gonderi]